MVRSNILTFVSRNEASSEAATGGLMRLADRVGDSARLSHVLERLLGLCRGGLEAGLRDALSECERQLVRLAEKATIHEQNVYFDSVNELKRRREQIIGRFFAWHENSLARLGGTSSRVSAQEKTRPKVALSLSDGVQLDESVVLSEIATKVEARFREPLYALGQRLGVLAGSSRVPAEVMPLGPRRVTEALRYAAAELDIPLDHRLVLHRCFERVAMNQIGTFYAALNNLLIELHILPALHTLPNAPKAEQPATAAERPEAAAATAPANANAAPEPATAPAAERVEAFAQLRDLLGTCRRAERYAVGSAELQSVLAGMQSRSAAASDETSVLGGEQIRSEILTVVAERSAAGRLVHLQEEDSDTIDLVAMLFESLARQSRRGGIAVRMLAKLELPMLRLALRDKAFFAPNGDPARRLLSELVELGRSWIDEAENEREAALADDLLRITQKIAYEYQDDPIVFVQALEELSAHTQRLAQRVALSERRQIDAATGYDKLELARSTAAAAIDERIAGSSPDDFVAMLLRRAWSDVLVMALLREGEGSSAYARRLKVVDVLLSGTHAVEFDLRDELVGGLTQIGLHESDVQAICTTLLGSAQTHDDAPISNTELAIKLKLKPRLGAGSSASATRPAALDAAAEASLNRLRALPHGTWFEFVVSPLGDTVRRKLAWFSNESDRCLLLDHRGAPYESTSLRELARDVAAGKARAVAADEGSFVDRAWKSIAEMLKAFSAPSKVEPTRTPPAASSTPPSAAPSVAQQGGSRTLLLVDDEVNVQRALMRVLRHEGYRILTATSANEAIEILRHNEVQVIVSDQRMPGMSGTELLSKVKVTHPNTVRLLLSGYSDAAAITEAINRGAIYKFLTKPWDDADFRRQVSEAFKACESAQAA